jgi:hypothetical protein
VGGDEPSYLIVGKLYSAIAIAVILVMVRKKKILNQVVFRGVGRPKSE